MPTARRISKMRKTLGRRQSDLTVVCENIQDPHNVSAILRTCDAVGVQNVNLLYTDQPFPELGKKSSASAKKWISTQRFSDPHELRRHLSSLGMRIYATHLGKKSESIYNIDWTLPSAIILGNEQRGISDSILGICDQRVHIPMFGMIESLNVSVAAAVILYEAARQRLWKGLYLTSNLSEEWIDEMLKQWTKK
jgi:tRNA (guanosine-2'-O-)-methyltransferase